LWSGALLKGSSRAVRSAIEIDKYNTLKKNRIKEKKGREEQWKKKGSNTIEE